MADKKIVLNESTLKSIISEAIANVINEIGNTTDGYLAIRNAEDKAITQRRYNQANKFGDYAKDLDGGKILRAAPTDIIWVGVDSHKIRITSDGDAFYQNKDKIGWNTLISLYSTANNGNIIPVEARVDIKNAKRIARWVEKYLPDVDASWKDWHSYALL